MAPLGRRAACCWITTTTCALRSAGTSTRSLAVSWKPQPDSEWTGFELEGFRDESVVPRRFSSDNRSVYLTGVREGETYDALYRLDLQTQQLEKVHAFAAAGVDDVITDFADRELIGVTRLRGAADRFLAARRTIPPHRPYQALQRAFPQPARQRHQHQRRRPGSPSCSSTPTSIPATTICSTRDQARGLPACRPHLDRAQADASEGADHAEGARRPGAARLRHASRGRRSASAGGDAARRPARRPRLVGVRPGSAAARQPRLRRAAGELSRQRRLRDGLRSTRATANGARRCRTTSPTRPAGRSSRRSRPRTASASTAPATAALRR